MPVEHALQLAACLPQCRLFVAADEGHHFFRRRLGDILGILLRPQAPKLTLLEGAAAA